MILSGKAKLAGVMGWPVSHSRSPRLHGFWLDRYQIDGAYVPLAVPPEKISEALRALSSLGFKGCNVTIPHKEAAFEAVDRLTGRAKKIGAVNTVMVDENGGLTGDNTDGYGFIENLKAGAAGWRTEKPAAVLGAGGAARGVLVALQDAGVKNILLTNRTKQRAEALAADLGGIEVVDWSERSDCLEDVGLLVNTTSLGMSGQAPLDMTLSGLNAEAVVTDIVYSPLKTDLLLKAEQRGNTVVDGLGMLLHQARPGFAAWFGVEPEVDDALRSFVLEDL